MTVFNILAALAVGGLPTPTASNLEIVSVTVEHADLDLANSAAQRALEHRVRAAIDTACDYDRRDLRASIHAIACRKLARAQAAAQVQFAIAQANADKARLATADLDTQA